MRTIRQLLLTGIISILLCGQTFGAPVHETVIKRGKADNCTIGQTSPAAGSFTTLEADILKLDHNTETLNAHRTILITDKPVLWFDCNGSDRNVILSAEASSTDLVFTICNDSGGAGEDLVIRDDTPTTLITLGPGQGTTVSCDGTSWKSRGSSSKTATYVIAASDSLYKEKADYICDGIDDQVEIQTAIDALPVNGGNIYLAEGTYSINASTANTWAICLKNNVKISGAEKGTVLRLVDGAPQPHYGIIGNEGVKNITISDLAIDGNIAGQVDNGGDTYQNGIRFFAPTTNITVENCYVCNVTRVAIGFSDVAVFDPNELNERINIRNNYVINGRITGGGIVNSKYTGNYIYGTKTAGGIEFFPYAYNNIIEGNIIDNSSNDGIQLYNSDLLDHACYYNTIKNNIIISASRMGIYVIGNASFNVIEGNIIYNTGLYPIQLADNKYNSITNNIIQKTTANQALILASCEYITIIGNHIYSDGKPYGLVLRGCSKCTIKGNSISAKTIGIHLDDTTDDLVPCLKNIIIGNTIGRAMEVSGPIKGIKEENVDQNYNLIAGNSIYATTLAVDAKGPHTIVENNIGFINENSGIATIISGNTSVTVIHGMDVTPTLDLISATPTVTLNNAGKFWISDANVTIFKINVDQNPGANVTFAWNIGSY